MKKIILNTLIIITMINLSQLIHAKEVSKMQAQPKKNLIVYFSHTGNTREIANQIQKKIDSDIFEIKTIVPYTNDYNSLTKKAKNELNENFMPKIESKINNIDSYDIIFIGYPIWWGTYPMAIKTFLTEHDLSNKIIIPFCTNEGSGFGQSIEDLKEMCPKNSTMLKGLALRGSTAKNSQDKIINWLTEIKIIK